MALPYSSLTGSPFGNPGQTQAPQSPLVTPKSTSGGILDTLSGLGSRALEGITGAFKTDGDYDMSKILGAGAGAADLFGLFGEGSQQKVGYQGSIPIYTASRKQVPNTYDPARRPGSGGQRYFTDVSFSGGDLSGQAAGLEALNRANLAAQNRAGQQLAPIRTAEDAAKAAKIAAAAQQTAATPAAATSAATPAAAQSFNQLSPAAQAAQLASALGNRGGTMLGGGNLQGSGVATSSNPAAAQSFNQLSPAAQAALLGGAIATPAKGFAQGGIAQFTSGGSTGGTSTDYKAMYGPDTTSKVMSDGRIGLYKNRGSTLFKILPAEDASIMDKIKSQAAPIMEAFGFEEGGMAELKNPQYLNGATDGMADEIDASIEGEQPAALSDGEFVIPADVVSHLGNGNSDAGAKVLEKMMARVRKERTGTTKQGKEINPEEFLPA